MKKTHQASVRNRILQLLSAQDFALVSLELIDRKGLEGVADESYGLPEAVYAE